MENQIIKKMIIKKLNMHAKDCMRMKEGMKEGENDPNG